MEKYVVDNSVVIKHVYEEEKSFEADKLFHDAYNFMASMFVPEIFTFEYFNIASRRIGYSAAYKAFKDFTERQFSIVKLDAYGLRQANMIMEDLANKISFYDASYHALAFQMDATFVTADERYYKMAKKIGRIELL